jgi:hypothetical protein
MESIKELPFETPLGCLEPLISVAAGILFTKSITVADIHRCIVVKSSLYSAHIRSRSRS